MKAFTAEEREDARRGWAANGRHCWRSMREGRGLSGSRCLQSSSTRLPSLRRVNFCGWAQAQPLEPGRSEKEAIESATPGGWTTGEENLEQPAPRCFC